VELGGLDAAVTPVSQHTRIHYDMRSCVFDEHMFFTLPRLERADVEALSVRVAVYDANRVVANQLIGQFVFDALEVYYQPQHQYFRR
jgi:hypothetical protein